LDAVCSVRWLRSRLPSAISLAAVPMDSTVARTVAIDCCMRCSASSMRRVAGTSLSTRMAAKSIEPSRCTRRSAIDSSSSPAFASARARVLSRSRMPASATT